VVGVKEKAAPHPAFGHPLPEGEGTLYTFSLREKDRMRVGMFEIQKWQ